MGVHKLWHILNSVGKPIDLDRLARKRLAIDTSIWLNQFVKATRDNKGNIIPNAHVKGLFARICKLLYFGIRPVFVFDGATPNLKKMTTASRRRTRERSRRKLEKIAKKLLINEITQRAIQAITKPQTTAHSVEKLQEHDISSNFEEQQQRQQQSQSQQTTSQSLQQQPDTCVQFLLYFCH